MKVIWIPTRAYLLLICENFGLNWSDEKEKKLFKNCSGFEFDQRLMKKFHCHIIFQYWTAGKFWSDSGYGPNTAAVASFPVCTLIEVQFYLFFGEQIANTEPVSKFC